jgi:predicted metal-binding membrane protein
VGSGWALMLVMFGIGMGSLAWMAALASLMVVEKSWRGAQRLAAAVGVLLLLFAALWLLYPAWLPPVQVW